MKLWAKIAIGVGAAGVGYYLFRRYVTWRSTESVTQPDGTKVEKTTSWQGCGDFPGDIPSYPRFSCGDRVARVYDIGGKPEDIGVVTQQLWNGTEWSYFTSANLGRNNESQMFTPEEGGLSGSLGRAPLGIRVL